MTLREEISQVRTGLKEYKVDTVLSNKAIYSRTISITSKLIQRESDALRLARLQDMYQPLKCVKIEEAPAIDPCCGISSIKKVYRTAIELPDLYSDGEGVIIKGIFSVDGSNEIKLTTPSSVRRSAEDTNSKYDKTKYAFYKDKRIYLIDPIKRIEIEGLFVRDISHDSFCNCNDEKSCFPFLDTKWIVPPKMEDDIIKYVINFFVNESLFEKKADDVDINKNSNK